MKVFIVVLFCSLASGCANFIANQITAPKGNQLSGNIDALISKIQICDDSGYCIAGQQLREITSRSISLEFKFNDKVWHYRANKEDSAKSNDTPAPLILIFPGFSQPKEVIALHQQWLDHITDAEVIVLQSADESVPFKFGLDFVSPVLSLIKNKQPSTVHLIGFSMGGLAAQAVADRVVAEHQLDTQLHLIAPMTDFNTSTLALWDILYKDKLYANFISDETVEEAVQLIYTNSNLTPKDTDLVAKTKRSRVPTFVYASTNDRVTLAKDWDETTSNHLTLNTYQDLKHIDMITLTHTPLMKDFVSNLLNERVSETDSEIIGTLCHSNGTECLP